MSGISLMEFIERREAELKELRRALLEELKQLRAAKAAIQGSPALSAESVRTRSPAESDMTIKEMALDVLSASQDALTAEEVLIKINSKFSADIQRTSLSPQLSRLKHEGRISYDTESRRWAIDKEFEGSADAQDSTFEDL